MAETRATIDIKHGLMRYLRKTGTFICPEVTVGINGTERVDLLAWDTDGTWRAYEVKVSKEDFRSKAAKSFVGHLNYFAMPVELYEKVKDEIPEGIGVWCGGCVVRRPTRRELTIPEDVLMKSLMRSCYRDAEKYQKCEESGVDQWERKIRDLRDRTQVTVGRLRRTIEDFKMKYGGDYHRRDAVLEYWQTRTRRLENEIQELRIHRYEK